MKPKILLVDDDKNLLHSYNRKLRKDFFVYTFSDANSALEYLSKNHDIMVIISDYQMPGMNGIQFLAKAKEILPSASRILITGHADLKVVISSINEGNIYRFLTKPFDDSTLFKTIDDSIHYHKLQNIEASDRLKNEFLTLISHEVRTPLAKILNYLELIDDELKDVENDSLKEYMSIINSSSNRFLRTIELIVKTAEAISGNYKPSIEKIDIINEVISPINSVYNKIANNKGLEYNFKSNAKHYYSYVDKESLKYALSQLLENAINYTEEGKVAINFISEKDSSKIEIIDSGLGMSSEFLSKLFTPFTQETTGYTRKYDGNGLGLTIVKYYLDMNNIKLLMDSKLDLGTRCELILSENSR